jgi:hypothetical protein
MTMRSYASKRNNLANRRSVIAAMRKPTWQEHIDDATNTAPYGIRWGRTAKGSSTHIMDFNKYRNEWMERCSKTNQAQVLPANVYLKAKICNSCTQWVRGDEERAYKADWKHYTDPATGRTKREKHN